MSTFSEENFDIIFSQFQGIGLNESDATLEDNSHANISDTDSETSPITAYERKTLITELHTITGFEQKMLNIFDKMAKRRKNALKQMKGSDEKAAALYSLNHGLKTEISGLRGEMKSLKEKTELLIEKDVTNSKKIEDQNKRIEEQAKQIIELKEHINGLENQTDLLFKKLEDMKAYARERESK